MWTDEGRGGGSDAAGFTDGPVTPDDSGTNGGSTTLSTYSTVWTDEGRGSGAVSLTGGQATPDDTGTDNGGNTTGSMPFAGTDINDVGPYTFVVIVRVLAWLSNLFG